MRGGFTLVELLVVIALMTVATALAAAAWSPARVRSPNAGPLAALRRRAIETGRAVTSTVTYQSKTVVIRALPDGRILGAEALGIDPFSGLPVR